MSAFAADQATFRAAVAQFATGVCIVTSFAERGPTGMTANAFASLSLDPLLVLVCFDRTARTLKAVERSGRAGVNVLADGQDALARAFASKSDEAEKFAGVGWHEHAGVPILDGVVAWLAGPLRELHAGGDHLIGVIGVDSVAVRGGRPLLYHAGSYSTLPAAGDAEPPGPSPATGP